MTLHQAGLVFGRCVCPETWHEKTWRVLGGICKEHIMLHFCTRSGSVKKNWLYQSRSMMQIESNSMQYTFMHARFWRSLPGCFSMSFSTVSFPVFSCHFMRWHGGTLVPHDALPLLQGTSPDAQRLGLKDWKIARQNRQQYDSSDLRQPASQEASQPAASEDFWLYASFLLAKHVVFVGTNNYTCVFFRWKLLIVTDCLIPSPPCKDVEDLPEMMVFDLDGAHLAAILVEFEWYLQATIWM